MKKILVYLLAFALLFSFAGCGAKENLEDKIAEKIIEETGGVDLDIDGDQYTIKGDNGETIIFGETEWPDSELASIIPEFKGGTINGVMAYPDSIVITVESAKHEDVSSYFEAIKKDFSLGVYEMNSTDSVTWTGSNEDGMNVALVYIGDVLTITVSAPIQ